MKIQVTHSRSKSNYGEVFKVLNIDGKKAVGKYIHTNDGRIWSTWHSEPESNLKDGLEVEILPYNHTFTINNETGESVANIFFNLSILNL